MEELIVDIIPEVIETEMIIDGTGNNFRIKKQRYVTPTMVIDEIFEYKYPAYRAGWASISKRILEEAIVKDFQGFKEWQLSNHPTQINVTRKLFLIKLEVDAGKVNIGAVMFHYKPDGTHATFADKYYNRSMPASALAENNGRIIFTLGEKVAQLDANGFFNNY